MEARFGYGRNFVPNPRLCRKDPVRVSLHRADRRGVSKLTGQSSAQPATASGRRRASQAPRRVSTVASPSLIGGLVLVVAGLGAATAGQAISAGKDAGPASAQQGGAYVATLSGAPLEGRNATKVSRSGIRPLVTGSTKDKTAAETLAERRTVKLNNAAGVAENYAQELAEERREKLREAAREAKVYAQELATERMERLRDAAREAEVYEQELANDEWGMPTSGYHISTWFGQAGPYWSSGYHTGIDFATAYGTPGVAVANATVVQTGWDGAYGNQVRLRLENGDEVWYNHLSSIDVVSGQSVAKGQLVGRIGDTGNSYGAHLHFEYRLASNLGDGVDPRPYFLEHGIAL